MQIMLSTEDKDVISFIKMAGFSCKRRCYEIEVSVRDYIGEKTKESLQKDYKVAIG